MNPYDKLVSTSRKVVLVSYALLLVMFTYVTVIAPPMERDPNYVTWMMHLLPLLIFLPGMLRGSHRTFIYLCFMLLIYFMLAVANAFLPEYGWYPWVEIVLTVVLFVSAMMHSRWLQGQNNYAG